MKIIYIIKKIIHEKFKFKLKINQEKTISGDFSEINYELEMNKEVLLIIKQF